MSDEIKRLSESANPTPEEIDQEIDAVYIKALSYDMFLSNVYTRLDAVLRRVDFSKYPDRDRKLRKLRMIAKGAILRAFEIDVDLFDGEDGSPDFMIEINVRDTPDTEE